MTYKATVELAVKTKYKVVVGAGLVDKFGQKLGKDRVVTFETGNARPSISMETGIYALETQETGYPIWTRNVGELEIECARVPSASVVKLLTSDFDYDPWYDSSSSTIDWKRLGLKRKAAVVRPIAKENAWHLTRHNLGAECGGGKADNGIYLASIASPDVEYDDDRHWAYRSSRRVLANKTDLGILFKAGPSSGLVWVTAISTGKPVAGAKVELYAPSGKRVFRGKSDRSGILKLPGTTKMLARGAANGEEFHWWSYRAQRMIALVRHGKDVAVGDGNWANGIQTWNFGVKEDRSAAAIKLRGFIQSDRGIYRPGETVKFKGLVREFRGSRAPVVPAEREIEVTVADARGATVYSRKHSISNFGGFDFAHALNPESAVGDYVVTATHGIQTFRERFSVEEFRKVTFETNVDKFDRHQRLGKKLRFSSKTDYLFGAPVGSAKVSWDVSRRPHVVTFAKFRSYGFDDYAAKGYYGWWSYNANRYANSIDGGEGKTDKDGRF